MKIGPANQNLAGPAVILPASSQLSLVGLHPCRAQLRFTGSAAILRCSITLSSMSVKFFLSSPCLKKPKPNLPDAQSMQSNCIERVTDTDTVCRPTDSAEEPRKRGREPFGSRPLENQRDPMERGPTGAYAAP